MRFLMELRRSAGPVLALLIIATSASCRSKPRFPEYSPHENLLSILTEFQLVAARDPYRERMPQDLTGLSIARSTLVRLANYEALHPGRLTPEVLTMKARCLELLGDYESARRNYLEAAEYDTELREDCAARAGHLAQLVIAGAQPPPNLSLEDTLVHLAARSSDYRRIASAAGHDLYKALATREAEDADIRRSELMAMHRLLLPDGEAQAQSALESLLSTHRESARSLEHALRLARFHKDIALEEVRLHPPERLGFSRDRFLKNYDAAADLLARIAQADGRPERLLAAHELDALLALGEQVSDRMR